MTDSSGWSSPDRGTGPQPPQYPQFPQHPESGGGFRGQPGVIPLRPLGVGEILDGAISTMRKYAGLVFGASAVVALISSALSLAVGVWLFDNVEPLVVNPNASQQEQLDQLLSQLGDVLAANSVVLVISVLTQTFLTGLLMVVVGKAVLGQPITLGEAWAELRPRLLPLLGLTILVTVIVMVGTILLIIPGIVAYVFLSLTTPALILERGRVRTSLSRSPALVRGSWWRVFGILLLAVVIAFVISLIIQVPFTLAGAGDIGTAASATELLIGELGYALAQTITVPFVSGVTALLYIDQRMRREGLDIELARAAEGA
ncbi:hypothetical protein ABZ863_29160 [Saccharomonospora sp. NPDC046836]|uniref:hypothetical protein n=1 Tax=Saccharomonospora sp. NPDC046836 TaxID=3156921 RepID=UPI0033D06152